MMGSHDLNDRRHCLQMRIATSLLRTQNPRATFSEEEGHPFRMVSDRLIFRIWLSVGLWVCVSLLSVI